MNRVRFERMALAAGAIAILPANRQRGQRFIVRLRVLIGCFKRDAAKANARDAAGEAREKLVDQRAREADGFEVQAAAIR